jgi:hypothetical protein
MRIRKPRIDLIGFENKYIVVESTGSPNKWFGRCKSCNELHEQAGREIQRGNSPMSCVNYKPPNWSGLEKDDNNMRVKYGISKKQFTELLEFQGGGCALCAKPIEKLRRRMNIDHDHITNKVRGILCSGCNTGLGHLGDSVEGLKKALYYLENTPYDEYSLAQ